MDAAEFYNFGKTLRERVMEKDESPSRGVVPASYTPPSGRGTVSFTEKLPEGVDYDAEAADKIIKKFIAKGYSPEFATGMAANAMVESSLNPTAYNPDDKGSPSFGLFQWRQDRLENLRSFADRQGKNINDLNTQLSFALNEFSGSERVALNRIFKDDPQAPEDYARAIDKYYEVSDGTKREQRARLAGQMYRDFFGREPEPEVPGVLPTEAGTPGQDFVDVALGATEAGTPGEAPIELEPQEQQNQTLEAVMEMQNQSAPATTGQPSPTGGVQPVPGVPEVYQPGKFRGGLAGLGDVFTRREGEGEQSFRQRRKAMFLNAAEGFQMLSRGIKADFTTAAYQPENQMNIAAKRGILMNQQDRLQKQLQLDTLSYLHEKAAYSANQEQTRQLNEQLAQTYETMGEDDLAALARKGGAEQAMELYKQKHSVDKEGFTLSEEARRSAIARANAMGRKDIADGLREDNSPKATEQAYKELLKLDAASGDPETQQRVRDDLQTMIDNIPGISADQKQYLEGAASASMVSPDTTLDDVFKQMDSVKEQIKNAPGRRLVDTAFQDFEAAYQRKPSLALTKTALTGLNIASNPEYTPNQLKGQILDPVVRLIRGIPGGAELADRLAGVTDVDIFGNRLLEAVKRGQLGELAQGVTGQLSNLEGQMLLSVLGDGTMERVEIMALSQAMIRNREAMIVAAQAAQEYMQNTPAQEQSIAEFNKVVDEAANSVETFENYDTEEEMRAARRETLENYAAAQGIINENMTPQEVDEAIYNIDFMDLPPEIRGEVVVLNRKFVPLFKEAYGDEYRD